eukprot:g1808.t1
MDTKEEEEVIRGGAGRYDERRGDALRAFFDQADRDKNGTIEMNELPEFLRLWSGHIFTDTETQNIFSKTDKNCDGTLSFDEIIKAVSDHVIPVRESDVRPHRRPQLRVRPMRSTTRYNIEGCDDDDDGGGGGIGGHFSEAEIRNFVHSVPEDCKRNTQLKFYQNQLDALFAKRGLADVKRGAVAAAILRTGGGAEEDIEDAREVMKLQSSIAEKEQRQIALLKELDATTHRLSVARRKKKKLKRRSEIFSEASGQPGRTPLQVARAKLRKLKQFKALVQRAIRATEARLQHVIVDTKRWMRDREALVAFRVELERTKREQAWGEDGDDNYEAKESALVRMLKTWDRRKLPLVVHRAPAANAPRDARSATLLLKNKRRSAKKKKKKKKTSVAKLKSTRTSPRRWKDNLRSTSVKVRGKDGNGYVTAARMSTSLDDGNARSAPFSPSTRKKGSTTTSKELQTSSSTPTNRTIKYSPDREHTAPPAYTSPSSFLAPRATRWTTGNRDVARSPSRQDTKMHSSPSKPWLNHWLSNSSRKPRLPTSKRAPKTPAFIAMPPLSSALHPADVERESVASSPPPPKKRTSTKKSRDNAGADVLDRWLDHFFEEDVSRTLGISAFDDVAQDSGSDSTSAEEAEETRRQAELARGDVDSTTTEEEDEEPEGGGVE